MYVCIYVCIKKMMEDMEDMIIFSKLENMSGPFLLFTNK